MPHEPQSGLREPPRFTRAGAYDVHPRLDLATVAAGMIGGAIIEIWGTTRHCWNYYDGKTPSPFPICGHGLAALCFWKMKNLGRALAARIRLPS